MKIYYHPNFAASYRKLPTLIKLKAEKREAIFRNNPFDKTLKTHKLHGKIRRLWSFSVDKRYRVLFEFVGRDEIFLDIGDHRFYR